jgi:hypothetical protein
MATLNQNFSKYQGDDFTLQFYIEDVSSLVGYSAVWTVANSPDTGSYWINKTSSDESISFYEQYVLVDVDSADTLQSNIPIPVGSGSLELYHELQLIHTGSEEGGIVSSGTFTLREPYNKR